MIIVFYLLISLLVGCTAMTFSLIAEEDIGIFFDSKKWSRDSTMTVFALFMGYSCMFGFALCYWVYRLLAYIGGTKS